jgi:hypothetical protein
VKSFDLENTERIPKIQGELREFWGARGCEWLVLIFCKNVFPPHHKRLGIGEESANEFEFAFMESIESEFEVFIISESVGLA